jgi:hypothetical protein
MSITSNIDVKIIAQTALASLKQKLPILNAITYDLSPEVASKGVSVAVPIVGAKTAGNFSGNYVTDASNSVSSVNVLLDQSTDSITKFSDIEYAKCGLNLLSNFATEDMYAVAKTIVDYALGKVVTADYQREYVVAQASFAVADVIKLIAEAGRLGFKTGSIVLNSTSYAAFLDDYMDHVTFVPGQDPSTVNFMGFAISCYPDMPDNSETLYGICCNKVALAAASRPVAVLQGAGAGTQMAIVTEPDSGISLGLRSFYDNATGQQIQGVHQVHGAIAAQTDALIRICTADQNNSSSST